MLSSGLVQAHAEPKQHVFDRMALIRHAGAPGFVAMRGCVGRQRPCLVSRTVAAPARLRKRPYWRLTEAHRLSTEIVSAACATRDFAPIARHLHAQNLPKETRICPEFAQKPLGTGLLHGLLRANKNPAKPLI